MKVHPTAIPDVLLIEPLVHEDERGIFFETFNERAFESATGLRLHFVQDNQSLSVANTCVACITKWESSRENWCA